VLQLIDYGLIEMRLGAARAVAPGRRPAEPARNAA